MTVEINQLPVTCIGTTSGGEIKKYQVASGRKQGSKARNDAFGAPGSEAKPGESKGIRRFSGAKPPPNSFVSPLSVRINTSRLPLLLPTIRQDTTYHTTHNPGQRDLHRYHIKYRFLT
jgi:hypothetical protein